MQARTSNIETIADEDIPEKVLINSMMDKYQAAEMPHRKVVKKLVDDIAGAEELLTSDDAEMRDLASAELDELRPQLPVLEEEMRKIYKQIEQVMIWVNFNLFKYFNFYTSFSCLLIHR